jgi:hypothetical protein
MTMGKRVKVSSKRLRLIRVKSKALDRLDPGAVAEALGAELVETGVPKSVLPAIDVRGTRSRSTNGKG